MLKLRAPSSLFRLFADGASRGNPGPSGAGAALYTPRNTPYARLSFFLGHQTNNAAEYHAVLQGLLLARSLQVSRVLVLSDSELLVNQITGRYSVFSPSLSVLHQRLSDIRHHFEVCSFRFVRREQNTIADGLANLAIDQGVPFQLFLDREECADISIVNNVRKRFEELQSADNLQHAAVS